MPNSASQTLIEASPRRAGASRNGTKIALKAIALSKSANILAQHAATD
jgi:hypothetical protein